MPPTASPAIEFQNVRKAYGATIAVDDVSLAVEPGQFIALVGPSGSGKTTLLKLVNRLIDHDSGTVRIEGGDIRDVPAADLRRGIGYVLQGIGLFPHLTIAANIAIVPRLLGWPAAARAERVAELLALVDLDPQLGARLPGALSGGQQQRIGVARALAARPRIVLLDEAFGALDPLTRDGLASRYRQLHDDLALTSILVTHDMTEALLLADRIVVLARGRIIGDATPAELLRGNPNPAVAAMMAMPLRQAQRLASIR